MSDSDDEIRDDDGEGGVNKRDPTIRAQARDIHEESLEMSLHAKIISSRLFSF